MPIQADTSVFIGGPLSGKITRRTLENPFVHTTEEGEFKYVRQEVQLTTEKKVLCYIDASRSVEQAKAIIQELFTE